jgi:hypothetical protein
MACPGSVALCKDLPDTSSSFADEGTDAHELAALCLETATDADAYLGRVMGKGNPVNAEMVLAVQDYLDYVRAVVLATNGVLLVEQRLSISDITGEAKAHGTSDVVILAGDELIVVDLKYGRGVPVQADDNPQLQIYGLAAYQDFSLVAEFKTVRMVIHQPRLGSVSEWAQTVEELQAFGEQVKAAAVLTHLKDAALKPTDKGCKFCKAKATCPALRTVVLDCFETIKPDAPGDLLAEAMSKADLIEGWLKAIRAEVETRLLAGVPVPGFKVVQGKKGNRAWGDKEAAEALLKTMRVPHDQMYDYSVISPTSAEKLAKAEVIGPRQWPKVQALITQSEGRPSVAPESDKRPALVMSAVLSDFDDVTAGDLT